MDLFKEVLKKMVEPFKEVFSKVGTEVSKSRQVFIKIIVIVVPVVLIIVIIQLIISGTRNGNCALVREEIGHNVDTYLMSENMYPSINGDNVVVELSKLPNVTFKEEVCGGTVKVTKVNDVYVKTFYLENCNYCDTKDFGSEKSNYNEKASNVEVVVYYNYYNVTNNNSKWSNYIPFEEISTEETNGVTLPLDENDLPKISEEAIITEIVKEDKEFYTYRDKRWLWYKNKNNNYSDFSSEQPSGYANKDARTEIRTEATTWSIDYPEIKDYRVISTKTAYRWYKEEDGKRVYWKNGEYYPEEPEEGYKIDRENSIKMYSYYDKMWRWYNGEAREYSYSKSSEAPNSSYKYKDEDITNYTNWSNFKDTKSLNNSNKGYREEVTNVHSRYLIKYKIRSFLVLDAFLERSEFESVVGRTIEEIASDINVDLEVQFKFKY